MTGVTPAEMLAQAVAQHRERKYGERHVTELLDAQLYRYAREPRPAERLATAIERHRDRKWDGRIVTEPLDSELYSAAVWFRSWQDHAADPDAPILD